MIHIHGPRSTCNLSKGQLKRKNSGWLDISEHSTLFKAKLLFIHKKTGQKPSMLASVEKKNKKDQLWQKVEAVKVH